MLGPFSELNLKRLRVFWVIGIRDLGIIRNIFGRYYGLARVTVIFIIGTEERLNKNIRKMLEDI